MDWLKRLVPAALFAALLAAVPQAPTTVKELAPGVWVRMGDRTRNQPANTSWVLFKDYIVVIDANCPWGAREVLPEIRKTSSKPIRYVFNTHYHGDHAYGGSLFTDQGAQIICSSQCAEEYKSKGQPSWDKNNATGDYSLKPYKLSHPTITFKEAMTITDGERELVFKLMGPGHSAGDASAFLPKERILFTGDLCVNWNMGNNVADADADHDNWLRALDRMAAANPATVVVGHGELGSGTGVLRAQHAYLSAMIDMVRQGIGEGKSADEVAEAGKAVLAARHKIGADQERNAASLRAIYRKLKQ